MHGSPIWQPRFLSTILTLFGLMYNIPKFVPQTWMELKYRHRMKTGLLYIYIHIYTQNIIILFRVGSPF